MVDIGAGPDVQTSTTQVGTAPPVTSTTTSPGAPLPLSLAGFTVQDLAGFTAEGRFDAGVTDHALFYAGRDDLHGILCYLFDRVTRSMYLNAFGYADPELNGKVWAGVLNPQVAAMITLDSIQAGGAHEKALLDADRKQSLDEFNSHFVVGQSATGCISHTKGGVLDGAVAFEGSTNWSSDGEGIFLPGRHTAGGPGYKNQNNTLAVFTNPVLCRQFTAELVNEHLSAQKRVAAKAARGG